jgi:coenzyme F420-reducing hydrogenase beta subunit
LNEDVRFNSTSGGVFSELALCVLRSSGFVAGVKYNDALLAEHTVIDNEAGLLLLRQSKYIQSDVKDIYRQTEVLLQAGKQFLFVGTPCQCAALMRYLKKPYDGLVLCDFICRGVNSPLAYRKYLDDLEAEYGSKVKQVWFKNKTYSWQRFCTKVIFENGKEYLADRDTDLFMAGYIKKGRNLYMRPSCGNCEFKGINRPVDITLGDFWGVVLSGSTDTGESGISLVIVHSPKGAELFNQAHLYREPHTVAEALLGNRCLVESARSGSERTAFFERLRKNGFKKAMEEVLTE